MQATLLTVQITVLSIVLGLIIAIVLTAARDSLNPLFRYVAASWVALARNTPALLQIYLAYFGLGSIGIQVSPYMAVLGAITFNNGGYMCEILRGGLGAIPPAQRMAGRGLGMTEYQSYRYITLPQVLRNVFLPITNQIIWALLGTSIGMIIGLQELTGMTTFLQSQTFRPFEFYFAAACIYFVIAKLLTTAADLIARFAFRWSFVQ